jgi:uncharacterized membrane protein
LLVIAALFTAGLICVWAAWACRRAQKHGLVGSDAVVWAGLALVFLLYSQTKLARGAGLLKGWGEWLRTLAKENGFYADRRPFQIAATVVVALISVVLLFYGLLWMWHHIKRYRLAIGFASLALGFAIIRFISLHEVDAWNAARPWARGVFDLIGAAVTSGVALARLRQLGEIARLRRLD